MSVPELRFKQDNGQNFPEWEEKLLGDLCATFKSGSGITSEQIKNQGSYPVYGGNGLRGYSDTFTHDGYYVLIGRQGALCGNINRSVGKAFISEHAIAVNANETSDTEWLAQKLDLLNLNRLSESSAQPGLAVNKLVKLKLAVPSKSEQTKIANFLTAVDEKITHLTQKYDLLTQYKKGVMQQIFNQELRFKDDTGRDFPEWELSELGKFIDEYKDKSTVENQHRVLTSARTGLIPQDEYFEEGRLSRKDNLGFNIVPQGFVTYRSRSDDGIFKFNLNELGYTGIISTYYPVFNLTNCNNKFFIELTEFYKGDFGKYSVGTSQTVLSLNVLKKIEFMFPCFDEQTKIARFFTAIDDKISITKEQLEAVKQYKQGLLQQMFV